MAVTVVDKDHRVNYWNCHKYPEDTSWDDISQMNHQPSNEKCQLSNEKLSLPLFTYWLTLRGWPWWEQQPRSLQSHDLTCWKKELSLWIRGKAAALQSMKVEKRKQNKPIIGSTAWNYTLAKLKQSILHQLVHSLLLKLFSPLLAPFLCLCEVQLNTPLCPARSFNTAPLLIKEIRAPERERKSAWRIQSFHLLSISYSNAAIML